MMENNARLTVASAIVLAGGRSSRMGQPKALLPFDDTPLIVHIVNALQPLFDEIIVVATPGGGLARGTDRPAARRGARRLDRPSACAGGMPPAS